MIPFTGEQFQQVFAEYNQAIWPMQVVLVLAASVAVLLAFRPEASAGRLLSLILAGLWLWAGDIYHLIFFSRINPAALLFAALFMTQAVFFFHLGVMRKELKFHVQWDAPGILGGVLIIYALLIYPLLGQMMGHGYPTAPTFGAPCPITIFTFGILLWLEGKVKLFLLAIPLLWSLIGLSAAVSLGMQEDFALVIAGMLGTALLVERNRHTTKLVRKHGG